MFGILGGGLIAGSMALMGLGFIAELLVHALPPTRVSPPISEEVSFDAVVTVGPSLSLLNGGESSPAAREKIASATSEVTASVA